MAAVYVRPPKNILEVFQSLPEGTLAQLINDNIVMSPAPNDRHQKVAGKIYRRLSDFIEAHALGETRIAPYDVFLGKENIFQPDIIFIANENLHRIKENGLHGTPDLVIEVLSPGTEHFDKGEKKAVYESCGVKEYWMIDPADGRAEGYFLNAGVFQAITTTKGTIPFRIFAYALPL